MVNNHGDRCCPLNGVVGPLINGRTSWLVNGGDPNHLLSGMDLQGITSNDDLGVQLPPKRKVFRFHETILRR